MANAKKCDRCGAFYVLPDKTFEPFRLFDDSAVGFGYTRTNGYRETLDLCDECTRRLIKFLEGGQWK